jgi:hypothetical protein
VLRRIFGPKSDESSCVFSFLSAFTHGKMFSRPRKRINPEIGTYVSEYFKELGNEGLSVTSGEWREIFMKRQSLLDKKF